MQQLIKDEELTFALEIYADHGEGRLKSALSGTKPPSAPVDIHLIASAGMCIDDKSIAARSKGYVFNCDGWNIPGARSSSFRGRGVEVTFSHPDGGSETFRPHSEVRKVDDSEEFLALAVALDDSLATSIFPKGAGQLHIYGSVNL